MRAGLASEASMGTGTEACVEDVKGGKSGFEIGEGVGVEWAITRRSGRSGKGEEE